MEPLFFFLQHIELLEKGDKHSQPFKKVISALCLLPPLLRSASISKENKNKNEKTAASEIQWLLEQEDNNY